MRKWRESRQGSYTTVDCTEAVIDKCINLQPLGSPKIAESGEDLDQANKWGSGARGPSPARKCPSVLGATGHSYGRFTSNTASRLGLLSVPTSAIAGGGAAPLFNAFFRFLKIDRYSSVQGLPVISARGTYATN
jgi:hypothetical protein